MGDLPVGQITHFDSSCDDLLGPAAVPTRVPTKSWPANHADRSNNDRTGHHDHGFVGVATTIPGTMFAAAATARRWGTNPEFSHRLIECSGG